MTISAGIDVGSSTIKLVVMEDGQIVKREVAPAASRPFETAEYLLSFVPANTPVYATGYGRDFLEERYGIHTITEIKAHAIGARFLFPKCSMVIDIGGQDVKVISLDARGRTAKFEMNDRCAAGTGGFLEIMASRLGFTLEDFSSAAIKGENNLTISALCTVFAESEVIGLINRGVGKCDIAYALHTSVAQRITGMVNRIGMQTGIIVATGGGSQNKALQALLEKSLRITISNSKESQLAGALGCAICATECCTKNQEQK